MRILRIVREAAAALNANKSRTFFMMAGTIIGIAALTVVMAIGRGTEKKVMKRVESFGPTSLMLIAGGGKALPPPDLSVTTLTLEDAAAVRQQIPHIQLLSPAAMKRQIPMKAGALQTQATVFAVNSDWQEAWDWYVDAGDPIEAQDVATMARVCVLGTTVAKDLFGEESPLGKYLQVQKVRFLVKGVLQSKGTSPMGTDFDNRILIPLTTGLRRLFNQDYISYVRVKLDDADHIVPVAAQVQELIHARHHITPPEEDDFRIITPTIVANLVRGTSRTLSLLVTALAAISLLVGGIVLMNILLISVAGRGKEIGLRRAVGASRRDILFQFLTESLTVTFFGMLIGCGISIVVCTVLAKETKIPVGLSWEPFVLALVFALVVGTFFGVQPARRAAATNPVRALR